MATRGVVLAVEVLLDGAGATAAAVAREGRCAEGPRYQRPVPGVGAAQRVAAARAETIQPYADARPALDRLLAAGTRVAVLVRREDPALRRGLARLDLDARVLVLGPEALAGSAARPPADADRCRSACAALGTRVEETVVVGDAGLVQAAVDAGTHAVWVDRADRRELEGVLTVPGLDALPTALAVL